MDTTTRMRLLIEPLVVDAGATLYDLEYAGGVLRVTVERPGGVDIGIIGSLTREISRMIDEEDPIASAFTLEVSSPGLERVLRRPDHFAGAVGSIVAIKTRAGVEGDRRFKGVLLAADEETATIAPADTDPGTVRVVLLADIEKARTVFEWGPAPKPGTGSKPGARSKANKADTTGAKAPSSPSAEKKAAKP